MKPPPRAVFELIDFNFEVIMNLSTDPYGFAHMWSSYLASVGWTEEEFEAEMERRVFSNPDTN